MTTARDLDEAVSSEPESTDGQISRRQWVRGAAIAGTVVAAGAGLAACGSAGEQPQSAPQPTGSGSAPGTTQQGGSATAPSATAKTTPPLVPDSKLPQASREQIEEYGVSKASAIPVGGGVVYASHGVVVTQPTAGKYKCFSSSCTHLGCSVNKVADGLIQCPCHGAKFSIVDGSVKAGPAQRPLTAEDFSIKDGVVILD